MNALSRSRKDEPTDVSPDPPDALASDLPEYTDFARAMVRTAGVKDPIEVIAIADDAIQNAYLALRANNAFDSSRPVRPWVKKHIQTEVRNLTRKKKTKDGELRLIRTAEIEARLLAQEAEVYALLDGNLAEVTLDDEVLDRDQVLRWVDDQVSDREREMLRLYAMGYSGVALADRLNASSVSPRPTRTGTVTVQLHRLLKRLAKDYTNSLRKTDLP
ncbi:MAG: hypothetical protein AAFX41_00295 [Bacteroidota bacterium]